MSTVPVLRIRIAVLMKFMLGRSFRRMSSVALIGSDMASSCCPALSPAYVAATACAGVEKLSSLSAVLLWVHAVLSRLRHMSVVAVMGSDEALRRCGPAIYASCYVGRRGQGSSCRASGSNNSCFTGGHGGLGDSATLSSLQSICQTQINVAKSCVLATGCLFHLESCYHCRSFLNPRHWYNACTKNTAVAAVYGGTAWHCIVHKQTHT